MALLHKTCKSPGTHGAKNVLQVARSTRRSPAGGPAFRAQAARWLCFSDASLTAAFQHACALVRICLRAATAAHMSALLNQASQASEAPFLGHAVG